MLFLIPAVGAAAPPITTVQEMEVIAQMSYRRQAAPEVQGRLQGFYIRQAELYQRNFDDTVLGRSGLVTWGDIRAVYKSVFAPPMGTGAYYIYWCDKGPVTNNTLWMQEICLPAGAVGQYGTPGSLQDTQWHEFNHAQMYDHTLNPAVARFRRFNKKRDDATPDHPLIEGLAERHWEWMEALLHKYDFEDRVREAHAEVVKLGGRGEELSYFTERGVWARAHEAWRASWSLTELIAPMPQALRDEYEGLTGVRIPPIEAVVRFYMQGGVKAADGRAIQVPEWVMWPETMICPVITGYLNEKVETQGDQLTASFDLWVSEKRRAHATKVGASRSLDHGNLTVQLSGPDGEPRLSVEVRGAAVPAGRDGHVVDLSGFGKREVVRIKLERDGLSRFQGVKSYRISVRFDDVPRDVGSQKMASFYYHTEAVFYVDVTGTGPGRASTQGGTSQAGGPGSKGTAPAPGQWVQTRAWSSATDMNGSPMSPAWIEDSRAQSSGEYFDIGAKKRLRAEARWAWTPPPPSFATGARVGVGYSVEDASAAFTSEGIETFKQNHSPTCSFKIRGGWFYSSGDLDKYWQAQSVPDALTLEKPSDLCILVGGASKNATMSFTASDGSQGEVRLRISILFDFFGIHGARYWDYELKPRAAPGGSTPPKGVVRAGPPPNTPPVPPPLDDEPPEFGTFEELWEPWEEEYILPESRPATRYYTHAQGHYRFPLVGGFGVVDSDDETDYLASERSDAVVFVSRDHESMGAEDPDAVLARAAERLAGRMRGARIRHFRLRQARVASVEEYDPDGDQMFWHFYLYAAGKGWSLSVAYPPGTGKRETPPEELGEMLEGLEVLGAARQ